MTQVNYLSHGGGVNSTALMLLLIGEGIEFESVFVDHGGDYPETYEYIDYLCGEGFPITTIKPDIEGCSTLPDYCVKYNMRPVRHNRWCTDKFKLRVLKAYFKIPSVVYIGIDYSEKSRAFQKPLKVGIENKYPLVDLQFNREDCINLISKANLRIPPKSCCYLCFNMRKQELIDLRVNHLSLYNSRKSIILNSKRSYAQRHYNILPNFSTH